MTMPIDYHSLFDDDARRTPSALSRELHEVLAAHPAPSLYRERLRKKLMAAAVDEKFYRRDSARRVVVALTVVMTVLLSVVGLILWRNNAHGESGLALLSR
jgi:hypothetical protein